MLSPLAKSSFQRLVFDLVKLTWTVAAVVIGQMANGGVSCKRRNDDAGSLRRCCSRSRGFFGLGLTLPCASAKRSRILSEVFNDWSSVTRVLSPRERGSSFGK